MRGLDRNVLVAGEGPDVLLVHGFPDSHTVWRHQVPALVEAGYRVIAPDTLGCGDTEISPSVADYRADNLAKDLVALLDTLGADRVRLVAHDCGAVVGWWMAMHHPQRVERYVALSVGHPAAYAWSDPMQKVYGWYTMLMQLRGFSEWALRSGDWKGLRALTAYEAEFPRWQTELSRPGRLTAGLNFYRANIGLLLSRTPGPPATVPVHGIWSSRDRFLTEKQMLASRRHVHAAWKYSRIDDANHWLQLDAPARFNALLLDSLRAPLEGIPR